MSYPMHHTSLILRLALLLCPLAIMAQPAMEMDGSVVNMGDIPFQVARRVSFDIKNTGTSPLLIHDIVTACGCTQAEWDKSPILPDETRIILVTYDAAALGSFHKELEIYTNVQDEPYYMALEGRVVEDAVDYDAIYPVDMNGLRTSHTDLDFGMVHHGQTSVLELPLVNTSRDTYSPRVMHVPHFLEVAFEPRYLVSGRIGKATFSLLGDRLNNYGIHETTIYLARHEGDQIGETNALHLRALVVPDFSNLSEEELAQAPHLSLSADTIPFSLGAKRKKQTQQVILQNTGQQPLVISRIQVLGEGVGISLGRKTIAPGEQARLKVTLKTTSSANPRVLIITNDPTHPAQTLELLNL